MKIEEIMQFTNGFGDPNSKMNQNVPVKFKAGVITSTQMRGQQENARGQRSDAKVWDIVRGLLGLGPTKSQSPVQRTTLVVTQRCVTKTPGKLR